MARVTANTDHTRNERATARREVNLHHRPDGGWNITGYLPELLGIEFAEIFAWFLDAEWRSDWADARQRLGNNASQSDLARTQAQRRADAMMAMARASVSRDPDLARPSASSVCVDILLDHQTMQPTLRARRPIRTDSATSCHAPRADDACTQMTPSMPPSSTTYAAWSTTRPAP